MRIFDMVSRRSFLLHTAGIAAAVATARRAMAVSSATPTPITVYKSSTCECCAKWVDHLGTNGFAPQVHDEEDMNAIKDQIGVPKDVRSCHTALVGKYLIEGHVPADDIHRLLKEHPAVAGLAVPGMPSSTPGMAMPGAPIEPYQVVSFTSAGVTAVYARH
jgi:hypothetical protein